METLYRQIVVALFFVVWAILFGQKAISITPSAMRENNQEDTDNENKAKFFEKLSYLFLTLGVIFAYFIK